MTRQWRQHYTVLLAGMMLLGAAAFLVLGAFNDNLVFFYSAPELKTEAVSLGRRLRITDGNNTIVVTYAGGLPDLFGEAEGAAAGMLQRDGVFRTANVLGEHDENDMPPEGAEALKRSGHWQATQERKVMR